MAIVKKHGEPWFRASPARHARGPESLVAVKGDIDIDLPDILKYAGVETDFIAEFASAATREILSGKHGGSEATLRRVRHLFVNRVNMRAALRKLVNATFAVRNEMWCGTGTPWASGSRKFGAWSSNLMAEWHRRCRAPE